MILRCRPARIQDAGSDECEWPDATAARVAIRRLSCLKGLPSVYLREVRNDGGTTIQVYRRGISTKKRA